MADSGAMREAERWVCAEWLPSQFGGTQFMPQFPRLQPGGYFQFDAVSADRKTAACISTSPGVTSGGKKGTAHLHKLRSDILFLQMAKGLDRRLIVLVDRQMWDISNDERSKGRLPKDVEILLAELPAELQAKLAYARKAAAAEVGG